MIQDLVECIGASCGWSEQTSLETGCGGTTQCNDGTWIAWVVIDDPNLGLIGAGANEGHALKALEAKLKCLGGLASAAYAEAESRYQVRKAAESKEYADRLIKLLEGDKASSAWETPKKTEEN